MNLSMYSYLDHLNAVLDVHALYKKVNKYKLRFKIKPWIAPGTLEIFILLKTFFLENS